jgi:TPR repeat protein
MTASSKLSAAYEAYHSGNFKLALRLAEECAHARDAIACRSLAEWYLDANLGDLFSIAESRKWVAKTEELAEDGDLVAQWELCMAYRFGNFGPSDRRRSNRWMEEAARGGLADAQNELASSYQFGLWDYPQDTEIAAYWYEKSYAQGHPETLYIYGVQRFDAGQLTDEAFEYLRRSAAKGFRPAIEVLRIHRH